MLQPLFLNGSLPQTGPYLLTNGIHETGVRKTSTVGCVWLRFDWICNVNDFIIDSVDGGNVSPHPYDSDRRSRLEIRGTMECNPQVFANMVRSWTIPEARILFSSRNPEHRQTPFYPVFPLNLSSSFYQIYSMLDFGCLRNDNLSSISFSH